MVHAGCVVAGIHLSRTWMSGSFESMRWNAWVHRLDPVYTERVLGEWNQNLCQHQGKYALYRRLRGGWKPRHCRTASPTHCRSSYSGPYQPEWSGAVIVCWLLNVPATCECISGTDLLRQLYVLPHWDRSCRSNFLPHPVTVYWHRADQS